MYPDDEIYLIPARLDDCTPHFEQIRALQYVDLFPEPQWKEGIIILKKLMQTHRRETNGNILNSNDVLRFRTHQARFTNNETICYFLTVTSISNVPIEITHLWYEDSDIHIPVKCKLRLLPKRLEVNEVWESWIPLSDIPVEYRHNAYNFFKVKVSTGEVFASIKDESVPPHGSVPGGDRDEDDLE